MYLTSPVPFKETQEMRASRMVTAVLVVLAARVRSLQRSEETECLHVHVEVFVNATTATSGMYMVSDLPKGS